jgi:trk system potassium uptake protein TrkH
MSARTRRRKPSLSPSQVVLLSFVSLILVGTALLAMPFAHQGAPHRLIDDTFMAASAVCVTGLVTLDPSTHYNGFGQLILLLLVQIGGLGYMTLFSLSLILVGRRLSMRDRLTLQETLDQPGQAGVLDYVFHIAKFTLTIEAIGAIVLATQTVPALGWGEGLKMAVFHAVSAFNNAGFSLFPQGAVYWQHAPLVLVTLAVLIIIGGLGYTVNQELVRRFIWRLPGRPRWTPLMRLVVTLTFALVLIGTLGFWLIEANNPRTLAPMSLVDQWANAFFMGVQPRSSGFNSIDMAGLERSSLELLIMLMFIGAGPGGTGGGIKLTTFAIVLAAVMAAVRGHEDVQLPGLRRRISDAVVRKAYAVIVLSGMFVISLTMLLGVLERQDFLALLFEVTSAFATVGLGLGITAGLSDTSKFLLILAMLIGRVGVLAVMLSLFPQRERSAIRYAEEPMLVG